MNCWFPEKATRKSVPTGRHAKSDVISSFAFSPKDILIT
jgi:hypothetical protein